MVREELPDGHPGRAEYREFLLRTRGGMDRQSHRSLLAAKGKSQRDGHTVLVGESFAESLINFAEQKDSDLIVVGGARDGFFGGHVIGPVTGSLLHTSPIPVTLAPRGYAEDPPATVTAVTAAVPEPSRARRPPSRLRSRSASAARLAIRTVTLVSSENLAEATKSGEVREMQLAAASGANCAGGATRALPDAPDIECLVADGVRRWSPR